MVGTIALALLSWAGCSEEEGIPLPEISWEGEHLLFGSNQPPGAVCGGTLRYMDDYLGTLREVMGDPSDEMVSYFYVEPPLSQYQGGCQVEGALGCADNRRILAGTVPLEHELVHVVFTPERPAHPLIEEGLSIYWGSEERRPLRGDADPIDVAKRGGRLDRRAADYPVMGHFMAYLMQEYGFEAVQEVGNRLLWPRWEYERLQEAFLEVVGRDFESLVADYKATFPRCRWADYHDPVHACRHADYEVGGDSPRLLLEATLDCRSDRVVGVEGGRMWVEFTVDLVKDTFCQFWPTESIDIDDSHIFFRKCDGACDEWASRMFDVGKDKEVAFSVPYEAGRYVVRFNRPADQPATMSFEILCD